MATGAAAPARVRDDARRSQEILDAAAAAFALAGYHGASTKDIADRLGIRQASLYYYFRSKQAALEQVCTIGIEPLLRKGRRLLDADLPPLEKLLALARNHLGTVIEGPSYARVFLTQRRFLTGAARERVRRLEREYEQIVETLIRDGVDCGGFRSDLTPRDLMLATIGICNLANVWQGTVPDMTLDRAMRIVSAFLVDGLCGHAEPLGLLSNPAPVPAWGKACGDPIR
ncbi:MAG: TetR/AcrR family transcriptional regulator [Burkholderiaceae bacterium]